MKSAIRNPQSAIPQLITVSDCLAHMESGQPFTFTTVTYDRQRRKGGRIIEMEAHYERTNVETLQATSPTSTADEPATRPLTDYEAKLAALQNPDTSRNPNHSHWYTRNVRILVAGFPTELMKIHPPLLIEFNGMTVVP